VGGMEKFSFSGGISPCWTRYTATTPINIGDFCCLDPLHSKRVAVNPLHANKDGHFMSFGPATFAKMAPRPATFPKVIHSSGGPNQSTLGE